MADSGVAESGDWTPAFAGQREPFRAGNDAGVTHGAYSRHVLGQVEADLAELRESGAVWLEDVDAFELRAWLRAERRVLLLEADVEARGMFKGDGRSRDAFKELARWQRIAARHRAALGLNPEARAALTRDTAVARSLAEQGLAAGQARGAVHVDRALGGGS